jgi:hypothetical protein
MKNCPVCNNWEYFEEGEKVDVGFGISWGTKVGPDYCFCCGYIEKGPDPRDHPIDFYEKCWELQINPRDLEVDIICKIDHKNIDKKYKDWIDENVSNPYGQCYEYSSKMMDTYPELRIVQGYYDCPIWGKRDHFFLLDKNNLVIDPTRTQFPTQGTWNYEGKYIYSKLEDLENDLKLKD